MDQQLELTATNKKIDLRHVSAVTPVSDPESGATCAVIPLSHAPGAVTTEPPAKQVPPATAAIAFITIQSKTFDILLWASCILNLIGAACYYVAVVLVHFDPLLGLQFIIPARSGTTLFAIAFACDTVWVASISHGFVGAIDVAGTGLSAVSFAGLTATAVFDSYALLLAAAWALFTGLSMKLFAHFHGIYVKGWAAALRQQEPAEVTREAICMTWALGVGGTLGALVLGYSTLIPIEQVPVWYSAGAGGIATAVAVGITNVVLRLRLRQAQQEATLKAPATPPPA